jgi:hypothetical protein
MKKKIFIGIAMSLFAVATVFNMNMLNENGAGDVSLDALAVMAQAQDEGGGGGLANTARNCRFDPQWGRCGITTNSGSYCPLYACKANF